MSHCSSNCIDRNWGIGTQASNVRQGHVYLLVAMPYKVFIGQL